MRDIPKPNEIYKHFKGNCYRIMALATETETRQTLVIYQALYGDFQFYARELSMFMSPVDKEKYPDVKQQWRFELVPFEASMQQPVQQRIQNAGQESAQQRMQNAGEPLQKENISQSESKQENSKSEMLQIDPMVMEYLDADTYEEKLKILVSVKDRITNDMINTMSIAVDVEIPDGDVADRYEQLKYCLSTKKRFECNRLR